MDTGSDNRQTDLGEELQSDATLNVPVAEGLAAIEESRRISEQAILERKMRLLEHDKLGEVPDWVKIVFSCVLGDHFHAMDRMWVPTHHEHKKGYFYSLMEGFFQWDPDDLERVRDVLIRSGWTDDEFESTLFYKPSFFRRRVKRIALPPHKLYYRVRAVFVAFGDKTDSKTGRPLFNSLAWTKARNLLEEIKRGFYSDPPGFNFYSYEMDEKGDVKTDSYGIPLLRCCRGTNMVECIHRQYNTTMRHRSGIEMGDAQLAERRHRHNIDRAQRIYRDFPKVGHYDMWKIDILQKLVEQNHGKSLMPGWTCVGDYFDTDESFVTVPLHDQELQNKLEMQVRKLKKEKRFPKYLSRDVRFLCRAWGTELPFLPLSKRAEFERFNKLMRDEFQRFDEKSMSLRWMDFVDG